MHKRRVLADFDLACKALFRDLAYGDQALDIDDARTFIIAMAFEAVWDAIGSGPLKVEDGV